MLETAQSWLITNWGFLATGMASMSVGVAVLGRTVKGVGQILGAKADKNAKENQRETNAQIAEIREDVAELKQKMYLDAKVNAENPVIADEARIAYGRMGTKSTLDKIEDGLDMIEKVVEVGAAVTKSWQDL